MTARERFQAANLESPVVSAGWLDKRRRAALGHPDTWCYLRYRLADGRAFTLPAGEVEAMNAAGFKPRWRGVD